MTNIGMKILFVARTYPPLIGGLEKFASDFYNNITELTLTDLLANPRGKKGTFGFFFKVLGHVLKNSSKYDIIHFNDATLSPLIPLIKLFSRSKITATVHGLDVIYSRFGYQFWTPFCLSRVDRLFPVSHFTAEQCRIRKIPAEKLKVIPNGIDFNQLVHCSNEQMASLKTNLGLEVKEKTILLSVGRLIKRKGTQWFIENVFSKLSDDYIYIVAGMGPEYAAIASSVERLHLQKRVILVGFVSDPEKACLYQMADLFLMPNIYEKGDQEGFGIVLIEAGSYSLPVIASDIEGITDAVIVGDTGRLVKERDVQGFLDAIIYPGIQRSGITEKVKARFNWKKISGEYYSEFVELMKTG